MSIMKKLTYATSAVGAMLMTTTASAEVPAEVTKALASAGVDASAVAWAIVGIIVTLFAISMVRRMVK